VLMTVLASIWHRWKNMHPKRARALSVAVAVVLLFRLFVPL